MHACMNVKIEQPCDCVTWSKRYLSDGGGCAGDEHNLVLHVLSEEAVEEPLQCMEEGEGWPCKGQHHHARWWHQKIQQRVEQIHHQPQNKTQLNTERETKRILVFVVTRLIWTEKMKGIRTEMGGACDEACTRRARRVRRWQMLEGVLGVYELACPPT